MVRAADKAHNPINSVRVKQFCENVADEVYQVYQRKSIVRTEQYSAFYTAFIGFMRQCRAFGLGTSETLDWLNSDRIYHQHFVHKHFFMKLKGFRSTRQIVQHVMIKQLNSLECADYLALYQELLQCRSM